MTAPAWIGLGSNLGDRAATLGAALAALGATPGVAVRAVSGYHETRPVGGPSGQGAYLNAAASLETTLGPFELLGATQAIEDRLGRVRAARWGERTIDIDILMHGSGFLDTPALKIPHPRLGFRRFVLAPLAEIAPAVVEIVSKCSIVDLLAGLDRSPRLVALHGPAGPLRSGLFERLVAELSAGRLGEGGIAGSTGHPEAPTRARLDRLARRIEALTPSRLRSDFAGFSWVVADDCPALDLDAIGSGPDAIAGPAWVAREELEFSRARPGLIVAVREAVAPTFVVILPGPTAMTRRPGRVPLVRLWPESEDPDAILAEVLATCRGIEGA